MEIYFCVAFSAYPSVARLLSDTFPPRRPGGVKGNFAKNVVSAKFRCAASAILAAPASDVLFSIRIKEREGFGEGKRLLSYTFPPRRTGGAKGNFAKNVVSAKFRCAAAAILAATASDVLSSIRVKEREGFGEGKP